MNRKVLRKLSHCFAAVVWHFWSYIKYRVTRVEVEMMEINSNEKNLESIVMSELVRSLRTLFSKLKINYHSKFHPSLSHFMNHNSLLVSF